MFAQALNVTFRILLFRAGPQDFPYDRRLGALLWPAAAAVNALVMGQVLPPAVALGIGVAMVAAMAMVTQSVLRARGVANRFQQTFNALVATTAVLTLALLPPFARVAPQILALAQHPEMLEKSAAVSLPGGPVFLMNLLNFWNFAVTAHIFRHAAGVNLWIGLFIAFIAAGVILFVGILGGSIAAALFGGLPA